VNRTEVVNRLAAVPLFAGLSKKELGAIAGTAKEVSHESGEFLAKEGDAGVGFFLILDGTARVVVGGRTRRRLGPGDTFGEIALLDNGPRTATVVAESPARLLGVTAWDFRSLLAQHPSITLKLLEGVAGRLRSASSSITA
jgi:CRP/FNR family transcriptional regulator